MRAWQPQIIPGGPATATSTPHSQPLSLRGHAALRRLRIALGRGLRGLKLQRGLVLRSTGRVLLAALVFYALGPFVGLLVALLLWFAQTRCDEPADEPPAGPRSTQTHLRAL